MRLEQFFFLGSTTAISFKLLQHAAATLAAAAPDGFLVNTSGYVTGSGARMQVLTLKTLRLDLIVAIGPARLLDPILRALAPVPALRLEPSPLARRKSPAQRLKVRQAGFEQALAGASPLHLDPPAFAFAPAPPPPAWQGAARPVCSLAAEDGEDQQLGILLDRNRVLAREPLRPVRQVRLGKMWAQPVEGGWRLLEQLAPAWVRPS